MALTSRTPAPRVRIGCAGWSIPARHGPLFGPGESHLARYATRFDVAEINSTFHRPHQAKTFERWAASVPARFRFSVKLARTITHDAKKSGGLDQALLTVLDQPFGPVLLCAIGLGLGCFGLFTLARARHLRED